MDGFETAIKHFIYFFTRYQTAYIDQRHLDFFPELQRIFQEISLFERNSGNHPLAYHSYPILQPPAGHIVRHRPDRHFATHYIHRSLAHESSTQYQRMCARLLQTLCHLQRFVQFHTSLESVAHVHLDQYCHIIACCFHHFVHNHVHETHPILKRTAIFIFPVIGRRRKELANQITMAGMNLYGIKTSFTSQIDRTSVRTRHFGQLIGTKSAHKCRRIQIKSAAGTYRRTPANAFM